MIHYVFASRANIGDWLSSKGIQSLLGEQPCKEHLCDEPFVPETIQRLSLVSDSDLIVIGGGGLFMDYFTPFWEGFATIAHRVAFGIWGVGLCDLKHINTRASSELLTSIIDQSQFTYVRDNLTRNFINHPKVPRPVECPTINFINPLPPGNRLLHVSHYGDVGPEAYELMHLTGKEFARQTERQYVETDNEIPSGKPVAQGLEDLLSRYASADIVMSSRLHGCVIGLAMGRKVIAVSADRKVDAFMTAAGLKDWVCGVKDISGLADLLSRTSEQPSTTDFLMSVRSRNLDIASRVLSLIEQLESREAQLT